MVDDIRNTLYLREIKASCEFRTEIIAADNFALYYFAQVQRTFLRFFMQRFERHTTLFATLTRFAKRRAKMHRRFRLRSHEHFVLLNENKNLFFDFR